MTGYIAVCRMRTIQFRIRKEIKHLKLELVGYTSRSFKDSGAENNINYGSPYRIEVSI